MANEIAVTYLPSQSGLTAKVFTTAGVLRTTVDPLTETPAASGLYLGTYADIADGNIIVAYQSSNYIGGEKYDSGLVGQLNDVSTAEVNAQCDTALADIHLNHLIQVTGIAGAPSATTQFATNLAGVSNDHYNNMCIIFTSGNLVGQARRISDYTSASGVTSILPALTEAPAVNDAFVILNVPASDNTRIIDIKKLLRADKVVDTDKTPWVTDYKEEGTDTKLMSKTMKNTANGNIVTEDNVLGRLTQE